MLCQGVRGATTATGNTPEEILNATRELLEALIAANNLCPAELASALFTVTPDLTAAFPARAARELGWTHVPLLDAVSLNVLGAPARCIRVLLHWNTDRPADAIRPVYLREAADLRPDLAPGPTTAVPCGEGGDSLAASSSSDNAGARLAPHGRHLNADQATRTGRVNGAALPAPEAGHVAPAAQTVRSSVMVDDSTPALAHEAQRIPAVTPAVTIAYQGEPGAYSQEAIFQHFGRETGTLACQSFEEIFAAVEEDHAGLGLLPIENSQTGSIHQSYDLLLEHDLQVVGEVKLRVRHCLLAPPGTNAADIRRVRSHPQALAQVEKYLKRRGWQAVPAYDTAGAARELAADPQPATAAIASALAGQIYGLDVLETGVEDAADNTTRFFLLSRGSAETGPAARDAETARVVATASHKTSLVFATTHTPGALHRALGEFAERGLNLTKIESRPRRNRPWHYVFYLDFEGHWQDPPVAQALVALLARAAFLKLLGSYPAAE